MDKIVFITRCLGCGGAERVIEHLIKGFALKGIKCYLILIDKDEIFYDVSSCEEIFEIGKQSKYKSFDKIKRYLKVRNIVKKIKPDCIISLPEEIGIYVLLAMVGLKTPVYVSERNNPWVMPYKKITRLLRKIAYIKAKGIVFQTNMAMSFFSKRVQKKGIVIPNPLDISKLPEPYTGQKEKIIVAAGRLDKQKNFPLLIDAFSEFYKTHTDYKLIIYGEGSQREFLEKYAAEKLHPESFKLPGKIKNLAEEIKKCKMFVLSSDYEGMPNVLIEAMAIGLAVISTDCPSGGPAEIIENNKNGILIPVNNNYALYKAMIKIAENEELSDYIGKNAFNIREKLKSDLIVNKWSEFLYDK